MFAISPTDYNWFSFLKAKGFNSFVNFWTPTPWNIAGLKPGNRLYFMLKSPIRKIGGYGEFVSYKNETTENAWNEFGYRNGRASKESFVSSILEYIDKNSEEFGGRAINVSHYNIGCIILKNCIFLDEEEYLDIENYGIEFPSQVVKIKYFNEYDPFLLDSYKNSFTLINEPRENYSSDTNNRKGQSVFKTKLLKAYNNKCCITEEVIPELLEAAHIQPYINLNSNHIQNGLVLRVDIHRLYDNGLIYIDPDYVVHISNLISNETYRKYHGKIISIPDLIEEYPSKEALESRKNSFRNL